MNHFGVDAWYVNPEFTPDAFTQAMLIVAQTGRLVSKR
jgi:hypothetical protein